MVLPFSKITSTYEHALAYAFHKIDKRGLLIDEDKLNFLDGEVTNEIQTLCSDLSRNWGIYTYVGDIKPPFPIGTYATYTNINSTSGARSFLNTLKILGFDVPKSRKKNKDGDYEQKESTDELALRQIFAETKDENISKVMRIRELNKMKTTYINARLYNNVFLSNYGVANTVTGRRSSKKHIFGFGGNSQNFPKHSVLGEKYRECIVARPGHIFLSVDQIQAEDWPVSALADNQTALNQMRTGVDRHTKLASFIFKIPEDSRTEKQWKDSIERYLGKKTRHANNYGMQAKRLSLTLAGEGFAFDVPSCKLMLEAVDKYDPNIKLVFHKYIQDCIKANRTLRNPLNRERQFFGFRPNNPNYELFNEAYSWIPQSTVGDNTGLAVVAMESFSNKWIVQEGHDSIVQEVPEDEASLLTAFSHAKEAFDREIVFYNNISLKIPIEAELGYAFAGKILGFRKLKDFSEDGLVKLFREMQKEREDAKSPIGGLVTTI